ncbi:MAG: SMP-30/gluconolactonase/LRE family protein [Oricola sp.]|nr:SMP-30/gluconolactonase/LRE family protein [Oricola sp.]
MRASEKLPPMTAAATDFRYPSVEVAVRGQDQLGETPLWCDREQTLWWVDIEKPKLQSFSPSKQAFESWDRDCTFLGSQALTRSGRRLVAEDLSLKVLDTPDSLGDVLIEVDHELDNRLNDGRVDARGHLWIGTMDNELHRPNGALYRIAPDGSSDRIMDGVIVSNGIAFAPDGSWMHFTDTRRHISYLFTLDPEDGAVTDKRVFADHSSTGDRPDGACVDVDGCIWTAFFAGSRIVRYTPDGRIDRTIELPVTNPTCLCFGGPDLSTLFVTTARKFLDERQLAEEPLAGSLLAIPGVGQGLPEHRFGL